MAAGAVMPFIRLPEGPLRRDNCAPENEIPRMAAGLDACHCSASSLIVPVSGLALAPCWRSQVAGRSTGQGPRASLDQGPEYHLAVTLVPGRPDGLRGIDFQ